MNFVNVADLCPPGETKSYRELNMEKTWNIPLDSLVKVTIDADEEGQEDAELTLFVTKYGRDCDGTPLYYLSHLRSRDYHERCVSNHILGVTSMIFYPPLVGGYCEESLTLVK